MKFKHNDVVLFQGDSITDANRQRPSANPPVSLNNVHHLGCGYASKAAGMLLATHIDLNLTVHNRGVSGNKVTDLRDRWEDDCLILKPTVLSILVGINDTASGAAKGTPEDGVGIEEFDAILRTLISDTKEALPSIAIVLCEPFTTEAGNVVAMNFHPDIDERRAKVRAIADEMADVFVPFQNMFDDLCKSAPPEYWAKDGVHPTPGGHQKMAEFWVECVRRS